MPGPIEFMGEEPAHDIPDTEYGGHSGLIQPLQGDVLLGDPAASGGHMLDGAGGSSRDAVGEKAAIMSRAATNPLSATEAVTGVPDVPGIVEDWASGRLLPGDAAVAIDAKDPAGSGALSEVGKPDALGGSEVLLG